MNIPTEFTSKTDVKIGQVHFNDEIGVTYLELKNHQKHQKDYIGVDLHLTRSELYWNFTGKEWFDGTMDRLVSVDETIESRMIDENHIERIIVRKEKLKMTELPGKIFVDKDISKLKQICKEYGKTYCNWKRFDVYHELAEILETETIKTLYVCPFRRYGKINVRRWENGPTIKRVDKTYFMDDILFFPRDSVTISDPIIKKNCEETEEDFIQTSLFG